MTKRNYLKYRKGELYFRNLLYKPVSLCLIALGINIKKIKLRYEYKVCSKKLQESSYKVCNQYDDYTLCIIK